VFRGAVRNADAVWPIAPEQDGVLLRITDEIVRANRVLLGCRRDAVQIATSKQETAKLLACANIAAIPAYADERSLPREIGAIVVKPDDGAGCQETLLFRNRRQLHAWLRDNAGAGVVFQPYIRGDARSLSLICCDGRARLLACNRQKVRVAGNVFEFSGVSVGTVGDPDGCYARLANAVARAMPGLWGCCGVDFVETSAGPVVVEVNPRLTTSYAGLHRMLGINPAQLVLGLPGSLETLDVTARAAPGVEAEAVHAR
jgi:predicted ATP-grasp superfamily ATP-dependent carboligase